MFISIKMKVFVCGILLLFVGIMGTARADMYRIGTYPIPLMVVDTDSGLFVLVFKEIEKRIGQSFEITLAPPKRTLKGFTDREIIGYFPALEAKMPKDAVKSEPFFIKHLAVFVRKGSPFIKTVEDLRGKRVGLTLGYSYPSRLTSDKNIEFDYAKEDISSLKKLSMGRIDAFVSDEFTGLKILKDSGIANIDYNPEYPLDKLKVYFAFQPTEEGKALAEEFSKALRGMKTDGTLTRIISETLGGISKNLPIVK